MDELIARARRGDADAFALMVSPVADRLFGAAYLILRDRGRAEDAVQDGLLRAWRELPGLRDPGRFEAWIRRIVMRTALDEARRSRSAPRFSVVVEAEPGSFSAADLVVARDTLERGFARLSPEHRTALVLRHYLSLTVPEIAHTLGIPVGTAKSRLHHATQALRAAIEADNRAAPRSRSA